MPFLINGIKKSIKNIYQIGNMSNKSRSRKRKYKKVWILIGEKIGKFVAEMVESRTIYQKHKEKSYPKFASGGTVYGTSNQLIHGGEMVVPCLSKGGYMSDNDQYMFQND
jgi:hypothetical protein